MRYKNDSQTYGGIAKLFHWVIALLILVLILVGLYMTEMPYSPQKLEIYALHKSFGLMVLWLAGLRILWRLYSKPPKPHENHQKWEKALSIMAHIFLYVAMLGMPLSGWVMSSANEYPVPFFGIQMPDIVSKNPELARAANQAHNIIGYLLIAVIGLHVAGALKHHIIDKDSTLNRMMPSISKRIWQPFLLFILLIFGIALFKLLPPKIFNQKETAKIEAVKNLEQGSVTENKHTWKIVQNQSRINFTGNVYKTDFTGSFTNFYGDIIFDPDNLTDSKANIKINLKSVDSGDAERDSQMLGEVWFNVASHPIATFESLEFNEGQDSKYIVTGNLMLAGKTMPLTFPFTLDIVEKENGSKAFMNAEFKINRLDYNLGGEEWTSADSVGHNVLVNVRLMAENNP